MKTAEGWIKQVLGPYATRATLIYASADLIECIQADSYHAGQKRMREKAADVCDYMAGTFDTMMMEACKVHIGRLKIEDMP